MIVLEFKFGSREPEILVGLRLRNVVTEGVRVPVRVPVNVRVPLRVVVSGGGCDGRLTDVSGGLIPGPGPFVEMRFVDCGPLGVTSLAGGDTFVRVEMGAMLEPADGPPGTTDVTLGDLV